MGEVVVKSEPSSDTLVPEVAPAAAADAPAGDSEVLTPLMRELQHIQHEKEGLLRFAIVRNDGDAQSLISLIDLKNVFAKQLPKMPKEYIVRLVLDRHHTSLACIFQQQLVGGITYRLHATQAFAEIAFCAVSATHQVRGYGTRLMNQLKEHAKREGIAYLLTYADNHAIGYFRKQGFVKQVTMKRNRWLGYIKDYDGGTLMECRIDLSVDYLAIRAHAEKQRQAVLQKMSSFMTNADVTHPGIDTRALQGRELPGLEGAAWKESRKRIECTLHGQPTPLHRCLLNVLKAVSNHADAWPFREPVNTSVAPDYYEVIKDPVDLSLILSRLEAAPPYYVSVEMLLADLCRMCENCRLYNGEHSEYWDCAARLEGFARSKCSEIKCMRQPIGPKDSTDSFMDTKADVKAEVKVESAAEVKQMKLEPRPTSRPSSRPSSRPASRGVSPFRAESECSEI